MSYLFFGCNLLNSLPDISNWNISNVNKMIYMFAGSEIDSVFFESEKNIFTTNTWYIRMEN